MTADEITAEIKRLQKMAEARKGRLGFSENVRAINDRIAELQQQAPDDQA